MKKMKMSLLVETLLNLVCLHTKFREINLSLILGKITYFWGVIILPHHLT